MVMVTLKSSDRGAVVRLYVTQSLFFIFFLLLFA